MSLQFFEKNDRWAVWSTVSDEFIVTDLFWWELIDWYVRYKERQARKNAIQHAVERIRLHEDGNEYKHQQPGPIVEEALEDIHE